MYALRRKLAQARVGVVMAMAALATVVGLGLGTATAGAAAQKAPLTTTNRDCSGNVVGTEQTVSHGFAIINRTGSGKLIANVVVQNATPNATYGIRLIQTGDGVSDCGSFQGPYEGTVTTDAAGFGNANVQEPVLSGATAAFVVLNNQSNPGSDFLTTRPVGL